MPYKQIPKETVVCDCCGQKYERNKRYLSTFHCRNLCFKCKAKVGASLVPRKPIITKTCPTCGSDFVVPVHRPKQIYCSHKCAHKSLRGAASKHWKGGRTIGKDGYVTLRLRDHPLADKQGRVAEHRLVASQKLGRTLFIGEVVHHLNAIRYDNKPENLLVLPPLIHGKVNRQTLLIRALRQRVRQLEQQLRTHQLTLWNVLE